MSNQKILSATYKNLHIAQQVINDLVYNHVRRSNILLEVNGSTNQEPTQFDTPADSKGCDIQVSVKVAENEIDRAMLVMRHYTPSTFDICCPQKSLPTTQASTDNFAAIFAKQQNKFAQKY